MSEYSEYYCGKSESRLDEAKDIIENLCRQFSFRGEDKYTNEIILSHMGVRNLEAAFAFLGWQDPHIIKEIKDE